MSLERWSRGIVTTVTGLLVALVLLLPRAGAAGTTSTSTVARLLSAGSSTATTTGQGTVATHQVGALFGAGTTRHSCTASVIHSSSGNLLLTAAHCVSGTGAGMTFAPGYANGVAPYGVWTVTSVQVPSGWITSQDPDDDIAVLTVASQVTGGSSRTVESVVGAELVGSTPSSGTSVTALGYVAGTGGSPVTCTTTTTTTGSSPTLACAGFAGGTSGGPWLTVDDSGRTTVVATVSGHNQGGCSPDVSYSAPLDDTLTALVAAASRGNPGQTVPAAGSDGC